MTKHTQPFNQFHNDLKSILTTLLECQNMIEATGTRHSWIDPAIVLLGYYIKNIDWNVLTANRDLYKALKALCDDGRCQTVSDPRVGGSRVVICSGCGIEVPGDHKEGCLWINAEKARAKAEGNV